jgi:hypothetical protein
VQQAGTQAISRSLNKTDFLVILGGSWAKFNKPSSIIGSFRRCGVTAEKVDVELMQTEKFKQADLLLNRVEQIAATAAPRPASLAQAPMRLRGADAPDSDGAPLEYVRVAPLDSMRFGSAAYFRHAYEEECKVSASLRAQLAHMLSKPQLPAADDLSLFPFDVAAVGKREPGGRKRMSGIYGCLDVHEALRLAREQADEAENKEKETADKRAARDAGQAARTSAALEKAAAKEKKEADYFACLASREASGAPCACGASGADTCLLKHMKFCAICKAVQASSCNKKACVAARAQPPAQPPAPAVVLADASNVAPAAAQRTRR